MEVVNMHRVLHFMEPVLKSLIHRVEEIHNPSLVITVAEADPNVKKALKMATEASTSSSTLVLLPKSTVPKVLWMADIRSTALPTKVGSDASRLLKIAKISLDGNDNGDGGVVFVIHE